MSDFYLTFFGRSEKNRESKSCSPNKLFDLIFLKEVKRNRGRIKPINEFDYSQLLN
jgi:hypothetical protein